ncbi:ribonuclease H family protein [Acidaminobacter hydrogenoformans]|uniref:ribonuclease H n=1 Tax=Acidaminobacter hydrogenoformans DSM 2784 TaxID=1120920 RepID=A0A1G5S0N5_9FIRM|nr:ribonuclease H [Acidaminobacter hydrogenoformans]SCZ79853.1 ribonuclease HI [Acidaminobacter hydrogenoformans DSM 2784]
MLIKQMQMRIVEENGVNYRLLISDGQTQADLIFNIESKELIISGDHDLSQFLSDNEFQLRRLLHNKRPDSYYVGFQLKFSMVDGKDIAAFNNRDNLVVKDHGRISVISRTEKNNLSEVYTDGSYDEKDQQGAYSILKKDLEGHYEAHEFTSALMDSSSIELQAVIKALEIYPGDLRIMTDSQYVRKGITEWMVHWKLNDWYTANGTKAKNVDQWLKLEQLCEGRRVEFGYVKAHNHHFENEYCDFLAREKREAMKLKT